MDLAWIDRTLKVGDFLWRCARKVKGDRFLAAVKDRIARSIAEEYHLSFAHQVRTLAITLDKEADREDLIADKVVEVCSAASVVMQRLLELKPEEIHCCIKILGLRDEDGEPHVCTWARSMPYDNRPTEAGMKHWHLATKNSVWSALLGRNDGRTNWQPMGLFSCNNLTKHSSKFVCSRENWQDHYHSTLVFPIQVCYDRPSDATVPIGYLAFDSIKPGVFPGMPDAFDYASNPTGFKIAAKQWTCFHVGAAMADTIATILRPGWESLLEEIRNGEQSAKRSPELPWSEDSRAIERDEGGDLEAGSH